METRMRKVMFVIGIVLFVGKAEAQQIIPNEYCETAVEQGTLAMDARYFMSVQGGQLNQNGQEKAAAESLKKAEKWLQIAANWASVYDAFCKD